MKIYLFRLLKRFFLISLGLLFCIFLAFYFGLFVHILSIFSSFLDEVYKALLPSFRNVTFKEWSFLLLITITFLIFALFSFFSLNILKNIFIKIYQKFFMNLFSENEIINIVNTYTDKTLNFFAKHWNN